MVDESKIIVDMPPVEAIIRDFSWLEQKNDHLLGQTTNEISDIEKIGFKIADLNFICSFESISEISDVPHLYQLPNLPTWVLGVVNLRGDIVPVVDLDRYLNVSHHSSTASMLIIIGYGSERVGLLVSGCPNIYCFSLQQKLKINPPISEKLLPYLTSSYLLNEITWLEIDLIQLIDEILK
jgi:chemotaxis signal transduction protein